MAFAINERLEADLPEVRAVPLPVVVRALTSFATVEELYENLPDQELPNSADGLPVAP